MPRSVFPRFRTGAAVVAVILALVVIAVATHIQVIRPGFVGVRVKQYGSARGVQKVAVGPGMQVLMPGEAWVIESVIDYGDGVPVSSVSIIETNDQGKVVRQRDYFASPFEAPEWRKQWVEQMENEPMPVG